MRESIEGLSPVMRSLVEMNAVTRGRLDRLPGEAGDCQALLRELNVTERSKHAAEQAEAARRAADRVATDRAVTDADFDRLLQLRRERDARDRETRTRLSDAIDQGEADARRRRAFSTEPFPWHRGLERGRGPAPALGR